MTNVNFETKNVNTGYTFYFTEFETNFFRTNFFFFGSNLAINVLKFNVAFDSNFATDVKAH